MKLRILIASVIVVPVAALLLIAGEPGGPGGPTVSVDQPKVTVGNSITGTGQGTADVRVELYVDGILEHVDDHAETVIGTNQVNDFSFPAEAAWVGKRVVIRVLDGSGQFVETTVTIEHPED